MGNYHANSPTALKSKTKQSAVICVFDINNRLNFQDNGLKNMQKSNTFCFMISAIFNCGPGIHLSLL